MIAKVIVDVPTGQTNRLYDYKIPEEMEEFIQPGMRVNVPFGPRQIQGFVTKTTEATEVKRIKEITSLLDPSPVLSSELLQLGQWIAEETICFLITAYQSMVPSAIRAKPKKRLFLAEDPEYVSAEIAAVFAGKTMLDWEAFPAEKRAMKLLNEEIQSGRVVVDYLLKNRTEKKMQTVLSLAAEYQYTGAGHHLSAGAKKQRAVVEWMQQELGDKEIAQPELLVNTGAGRQAVRALVDKGLLIEKKTEFYRDPFKDKTFQQSKALPLMEEQQAAVDSILGSLHAGKTDSYLLHGVTGSGKTEVYLQAIDEVISQGKEAIVLVPEISLTPQMVNRFKGRFGSEVAVLHSALSAGEKYDEWRKIHRKEVKVAVGARSAVFAPFENLGLIVMDEEHEGSYKQEDHPRYHAKHVAVWRAEYHRCPVVFGSATPSLESYVRAEKGVYTLLELPQRVNRKAMPEVTIKDMREELKQGNRSVFSTLLLDKLKERLEKKEQSVLFLNRRGHSTFVMCRDCGFTPSCPHCEITLTYHHTNRRLKCHYCGHEEQMLHTCPSCQSSQIRFFGTGTQKVEEELTRLLPEARVIRMDMDTTSRKGSHEKLLEAFGNGEADILLGTQMIAKGLDFPRITLAGILAADTMLHLPDFRSAERTFQLLTQVSGRAGRDKLKGEVVVQSYTPEHYSIQHAKTHNYKAFYQEEMLQRRRGGYPPFYYLTMVNVAHEDLAEVMKISNKITDYIRSALSEKAVVLGPTVSPIARIKDRYRYQCMIKYKNEPELTKVLQSIAERYNQDIAKGKLQLSMDMHPYMFM